MPDGPKGRPPERWAAFFAREVLRQRAAEEAREYASVNRLLYLQQCRLALEWALTSGRSRLRYRWADGRTTDTVFHRVRGRVRISGLAGV